MKDTLNTNVNTEQNTITIDIDDYQSLMEDHNFLNALRAAGVDNWDGYDYAIEIYEGK